MPETIKVERRKYHSHIYWRVIFPLLLLTLLLGTMLFVAKYPASLDAARTMATRATNTLGQQLRNATNVLRRNNPQ